MTARIQIQQSFTCPVDLMKHDQSKLSVQTFSAWSATLLMLSALVQFRTDAAPPTGQLLAAQCFQCHGTNGRAVGGFESINGKPAREMYEKLLEMSTRPVETIMDAQARAYTPTQLSLIASYLATLPAASTSTTDR